MKSKLKRAACVCLTGLMTVSLAASGALALVNNDGDTLSDNLLDTVNFENVTGKLDLTSVALNNLSAQVLANAGYAVQDETRTVIVTLDGDCIADCVPDGESVAEYVGTYSGSKVLKNINTEQENFLNSLASRGVDYKVVYQYSTVTNSVAIKVNTKYLSTIKGIASVKSAVVSETYAAPADVEVSEATGTENYSNIYPTGIYDSSKYLDEYDGQGITVAVLDTGIDYTHEAFQNPPPKETLTMTQESLKSVSPESLEAVKLSAQKGENITAADLYVSDKIPFAYDYADKDSDVYPAYSQHGVHVAGIVAGESATYKDKEGNTQQNFKGVAPNAQLVICKVFTDNFESKDLGGANSEDIVAALNDCVALGVDVINMSLGTTCGFSSLWLDGDDEGQLLANVYEKIRDRGISIICAASNDFSSGYGGAYGTNLASNPDSGTVGSPSTFNGALSVASVNGQYSPFIYANGKSVIYYQDSSDDNGERNNFVKQMLGDSSTGKFKYVVIGEYGEAGGYTATVRRELADKGGYDKVIAVVQRGRSTFKEKVKIAQDMGADAIIIYNNVAGSISMSLGDLDNPIPAISVTQDAGDLLCYDGNRKLSTGVIEISVDYQAGPFMNDYSSWGTTPDLKIKPEITSHGGEITSAVSGGYAEMSGTSMATPNLAGFVALLRGKLKDDGLRGTELNERINQIIMSTATTVLDYDGDPYSPRKQGSGLATLDNVFTTNAYLHTQPDETEYTVGNDTYKVEDGRPKIELGDNVFEASETLTFHVVNFGDKDLKFKTKSIVMTETISSNGLSVAEKAHIFDDCETVWTVNGVRTSEGGTITVGAGEDITIEVTITLSAADKKYIEDRFVNGMFVEGFIKLISETSTVTDGEDSGDYQCDLTLPFMGFYGDWFKAPMLDYSVFQIAAEQKDSSIDKDDKIQPQVWATQAYATYYNEQYTVPMGSFAYLQNESAEQIYAEEEHVAVSCWNEYYGEDETGNYMATYRIKALYTGLLRNAEIVTYDLYDDVTGELIESDRVYRVSKAYTSGGSAVPANVKMELSPEELGLVNNGKYRLEFHFYFKESDMQNDEKVNDPNNTFTMSFYVDYEAPVLADARIRYFDYKENNRDKQRVYLDLDIYDNHYAQAVVLCYAEKETLTNTDELHLATNYVTPVYNANKNGITTVSIEITDFYEKYSNRLYVQLDDYALNHSVWAINFTSSKAANLPEQFSAVCDDTLKVSTRTGYDYEMTLGVNEAYKVKLDYEGTANVSNFNWETGNFTYADVKDGEIFGAAVGETTITVTANGVSKKIRVTVVDKGLSLSLPDISFGTIEDSGRSLVKASGTVEVNAGQSFTLEIIPDPWYYPVEKLNIVWECSDKTGEIATVDQYGNVQIWDKKGEANIKATISGTSMSATVKLSVQEPFTVSGGILTAYHGTGGAVVIPTDKNVTQIATEAFKDNDNITSIVLPKTLSQIGERAFKNCTALEAVYVIQEGEYINAQGNHVKDSNLAVILKNAFQGCTKLKTVDFTNVKKVTLDKEVFMGCTALEEFAGMENIGTMNSRAFAGCTSLAEADVTGLHTTDTDVFAGCTSLKKVTTGYYTSLGAGIFRGCTALEEIIINTAIVSDSAFAQCYNLKSVTFNGVTGEGTVGEFVVGSRAFYDCYNLTTVNGSEKIASLGDYAFAGCEKLSSINLSTDVAHGIKVFDGTGIASLDTVYDGAIYSGTTLVLAPENITSSFTIKSGTTEIAANAFASSTFANGVTLEIPESVKVIGDRAFYGTGLKSIKLGDGLEYIGAYAFAGTSLDNILIPASVTEIGAYAFTSSALSAITFENSDGLILGTAAFLGCSKLTEVTLPNLAVEKDGEVYLGALMFAGCTSLVSVDLANVTQLGFAVFGGVSVGTREISACTALESIDLSNVKAVGEGAFNGCIKLTSVTALNHVEEFGAYSFYGVPLTQLNIGGAKVIGEFAFYGNLAAAVVIPAGLSSNGLGGGAFANAVNLTAFEVEDGNTHYFTEDGILYRTIAKDLYEVCAYPSGKILSGDKVYEIKEGTITVKAYAFSGLTRAGGERAITEVRIPYSIQTIGDGAFYNSGITSYVFESINAPVLNTSTYDVLEITSTLYSLYYLNFEDEFVIHSPALGEERLLSTLKISYPTNGIGYNNYVYTNYFGSVTLLGEYMDDNTRAVKNAIEGFMPANEIAAWAANSTRDKVLEFCEAVKAAHANYNNITSAAQLEFLGSENIQKLSDIENALKQVKKDFNIPVLIKSIEVSADSTYKVDYKAGEKFDMTGLQLIIVYDDFTTELADMSKAVLAYGYDGELTILNRYVVVEYGNESVMVRINVTEDGDETNSDGSNGGVNPAAIYVPIIVVVVLAGIAVALFFVFKNRKSKKSTVSASGDDAESVNKESENEETVENKSNGKEEE